MHDDVKDTPRPGLWATLLVRWQASAMPTERLVADLPDGEDIMPPLALRLQRPGVASVR